jgi:hypothetical protein
LALNDLIHHPDKSEYVCKVSRIRLDKEKSFNFGIFAPIPSELFKRAAMRLILIIFASFFALASCSGKKTEERKAEEPADVAGGFGLTMQCTVLNKDVEDAESSSIGCLVFNDDGSRYTGSIDGTTAEIVKTSGGVMTNGQIVSGAAAGSYSIGVAVAGLKPGDAATIRVSAKFDNTARILVSSLKGRLATTCDEDVTYYVKKSAENDQNIFCTEDAPCSTINKALVLMPDIINCKITINIGSGIYEESVIIDDKQMQRSANLYFVGESKSTTIIRQPTSSSQPAHIQFIGLYGSVDISESSVTVKEIWIDGINATSNRGFDVRSSSLGLEKVKISNYYEANYLTSGSSIHLNNVNIESVRRGLYASLGTAAIRLEGTISILGKSGDRALNPAGLTIMGADQLSIGSPCSLTIESFDVGLNIRESVLVITLGNNLDINNVGTGLNLKDATVRISSALNPTIDYSNVPFNLSITNFSEWGIFLARSVFNDQAAFNLSKKFKLTLEGATSSNELIRATEGSSVKLFKSEMSFCLQTPSTKTPWFNETNNISFYAFNIDRESDAFFTWAQSPFRTSSTCTHNQIAKLYVQTYLYRFAVPSSGAGECPIGYQKTSDNVCYGGMGYARHSLPTPPANTRYFGVLESDSRIDNLPTP